MHERLRRIGSVLKATWQEWKGDHAMMLAAAVAFYATFSLAPLLLLLLHAGAIVFGRDGARAQLIEFVRDTAGGSAARAVGRLVAAASETEAGATAVSAVLLIATASAVFRHLKMALNLVFDVPTRKEHGVLRFLRARAFAALMAVIGILLLVSALGVTAALAWLRQNAPQIIGDAAVLWRGAELLVSFTVVAVVFAAILKFVPDFALRWRHAAMGAAIGALVFSAGQLLLSVYVARVRFTAAYGAAGSVVLLLVYVYFTVAVILAAAELTEVLARRDDEFRDARRRVQDDQHYQPRKSAG